MLDLRDRLDLLLRLTIGALVLLGCYLVISPFLTSIILAAILTLVSWPLFERLRKRLGDRPTAAAAVMVSIMVVTILIPLALVGTALARQVPEVIGWTRDWLASGMHLPAWLSSIPYLGAALDDLIELGLDPAEIRFYAQKMFDPAAKFILSLSWDIGLALFQLALVAFVAFFFYRDGATLSRTTILFINRASGGLAGEITSILVNTTRSVVFGVIGTAIGQGLVAAVGFAIAGVPALTLLSLAVCVFSIIPVGPPLIWGPVALWLFATGHIGMGVFMLLWGTLAVSSVDNFLKPILISRGTSMPLALVFLGIFGGILAFGFLGLVLGPVLLATTLAMIKEWFRSPHPVLHRAAADKEPGD